MEEIVAGVSTPMSSRDIGIIVKQVIVCPGGAITGENKSEDLMEIE